MKLTILGANGPYPAAEGACSGYLLSSDSGETHILFDCGTGSLAALRGVLPLESLTAVVLTHLHYDHMSDMLPMQYALQFSKRAAALPVLAPEAPAAARALLDVACFDLFPPEDRQIGEMRLTFIPGVHPVPCVCVAVECDGARFVYTGDTNQNPALELFADGADLLLADAGLSTADWSARAPHLSAAMCGQLARSCRAKALLLTHLNPKYDPADLLAEARAFYPNAELAVRGDTHFI